MAAATLAPPCGAMLLSSAGPYLDCCLSHGLRSACLGGDFRGRLAAWQPLLLGSIVRKEASFVLSSCSPGPLFQEPCFGSGRGQPLPTGAEVQGPSLCQLGSVLSDCPVPWVPGIQNSLPKCPSFFQGCMNLFPMAPVCAELT